MDESGKIQTRLSNINKENPFKIPDGYFNDFQEKMRERINASEKLPVARKHVLSFKHYAAAAVLLIVALIGGNFIFRNHAANAEENLSYEISILVEQNLYSINEETIVEAMETDQPEIRENSLLDNGEALEYLLNEDMNENELINAL